MSCFIILIILNVIDPSGISLSVFKINRIHTLSKKKILRKSSEEIIEISNQDLSNEIQVEQTVRDVERHVMLWDEDHARLIDNQSSIQQIVVRRSFFSKNNEAL